MRMLSLALLSLMCSFVKAQTPIDEAQKKYQRDLETYFQAIHAGALAELGVIYAALPADRSRRLARGAIRVEIRSGADAICFNSGRFRIAASYLNNGRAAIVLCEPDIAHLTDAIMIWQLAFATPSEHIARLKLAPNQPFPSSISNAIKEQARRGVEYFVDANKAKKEDIALNGRTDKSTCFAWHVAQRIEQHSGAIQCSRRDISERENAASAKEAFNTLVKAARLAILMADPTYHFEEITLPSEKEAVDLMLRLRSDMMTLIIHYAVAHEIGHLTSPNPADRSELAEVDADRIALATLGKSSITEASSLFFAALAMQYIWSMAGDPQHFGRAEALHRAIFCEKPSILSANHHASKVLDGAIHIMASGCR